MLIDTRKVEKRNQPAVNKNIKKFVKEQLLPTFDGQRWQRESQLAEFKKNSGLTKVKKELDIAINNSLENLIKEVREQIKGQIIL